MTIAILTFISTFMLISTGGLLLFNREKKLTLSSILTRPDEPRGLAASLHHASASLGTFVSRFAGVMPKSSKEVSVLRRKLVRAGFREDSAVKIFYGSKLVAMLVFLSLVLATGIASLNYFMVISVALGFGFLAPDFWLTRRIMGRQRQIRRALPDVLDLLVVCVEAGLSLDQAVSRAAKEVGGIRSAIADEFSVVTLEQRAGCPRVEAWKHLADRTNVDSVRHLVSMVAQSEELGTSIARTLRVHSQTLRTRRIQQVEELAAKTGVKILFPLVLCIFPNLFLVVLGPALMLTLDSLRSNFNH
jgi:tight adherence protein C